jgi:hypothetical protein
MTEYIVDTNVPLVAQGTAAQMSSDCVLNCVNFLDKLFQGHFILVIDTGYYLIGEYQNQMDKGNQYGNRFLKWVYTNQANPQKIKTVDINQLDEFNFKEVPQSLIDIGFDNSDRKILAVAMANKNQASIAQAADSKWIGWEDDLKKEGITVHFLCKEELKVIYQTKKKN